MEKEALVQEVKDYIIECYKKNKAPPSVRSIAKRFNISLRQFYKLFPKGLEGICKELDIELPERLQNIKNINKKKHYNELAHKLFQEFAKGRPLTDIVIEQHIDPNLVYEYFEKWVKLQDLPNINYAEKVKELEVRIRRIENFIEEYLLERIGELEEVLGIEPL